MLEKIINIVAGASSEHDVYMKLYDLYNSDSAGCCIAVCEAINLYAEVYEWWQIKTLSSAMNMIKLNESAMP